MRLLFITFLLLPKLLSAQDTLVADAGFVPEKKNEFGITVTPLASMLLGKDFNDIPYGLQYKRWLGGDIWFTIDGHMDSYTDLLQFTPTSYVVDSLHFNQRNTYRRSGYALASGIEIRRYAGKGITFGSGIQATWKNDYSRRFQELQISSVDSVSGSGTAFPNYHITFLRDDVLSEEYTTTNYYGITLSGLVMFPLGDSWWINGRYRLTGFMGNQSTLVVDHVAGTTSKKSASLLMFEAPRPTVELAVMYRF